MTLLHVQAGGGDTVAFDHSFTAGRGSDKHHPDLVIDDDYASTLHAAFTYQPGEGWYVQDMGSTNGTWRGDGSAYAGRIWGPELIRRGDKIRIGRTVLICVPA